MKSVSFSEKTSTKSGKNDNTGAKAGRGQPVSHGAAPVLARASRQRRGTGRKAISSPVFVCHYLLATT